jgi:hypothetical protein
MAEFVGHDELKQKYPSRQLNRKVIGGHPDFIDKSVMDYVNFRRSLIKAVTDNGGPEF